MENQLFRDGDTMNKKSRTSVFVVFSAAVSMLFGCTTKISYFNAIESGPEDGQYFVSVVADTYSEADGSMVRRESAILEYQADADGKWEARRVVVEGVDSQLQKLLDEALASDSPSSSTSGSNWSKIERKGRR